MSRARDTSVAWMVADDPDQATEDLTRDWAVRRTPTWAIDTGLPDPNQLTPADQAQITQEQRTALAAVLQARAATAAATGRPGMYPSSDRLEQTTAARAALAGVADQTRLDRQPALGDAARRATDARRRVDQLQTLIDHGGWRDRRAARRQLPDAIEAATDAAEHLQTQVDTEADRLQQEVAALEATLDDIGRRDHRAQKRWHTVAEQQAEVRRRVQPVARYLDRTRRDLDHPAVPSRTIRPNDTSRSWSAVPAAGLEPTPAHEAPAL